MNIIMPATMKIELNTEAPYVVASLLALDEDGNRAYIVRDVRGKGRTTNVIASLDRANESVARANEATQFRAARAAKYAREFKPVPELGTPARRFSYGIGYGGL